MNRITYTLIFLVLSSMGLAQNALSPKFEFRGAWIATGKNIDYPTSKTFTSEEQKKEFIELIEMHKRNGLNAILFQIRPSSDAFYDSKIEPWSEWLTGQQGRAPNPYYDPLKFMIQETHKRGMEYHAWFNPFRAVFTIQYANISNQHISVTHPEWCIKYGLHKYLNPGIPEVREYIIKVIMDVVKRYDIDGVHFDDYFYPYPEMDANKQIIPFDDDAAFALYKGSFTNKDDWRRYNIDDFIDKMNKAIKAVKPFVKFGVGPAGIWRNKDKDPRGSDTRGFQTYDYLYADVLKWLQKGWVDYVSPQVYWYIGNKGADFKTVVDWWVKNSYGRHVYVGLSVASWAAAQPNSGWDNPKELPDQIRYLHSLQGIQGSIFYNSASFRKNPYNFNDSLQKFHFKSAVFCPPMRWMDSIAPDMPVVQKTKIGTEIFVSWMKEDTKGKKANDTAMMYAIYKFPGTTPGKCSDEYRLEYSKKNFFVVERRKKWILFGKKYTYAITSIDRFFNESNPSPIIIKLKE